MTNDKIAEIRARQKDGAPGQMPIAALCQCDADREFLLAEVDRQRAEIERLTRECNEARAEYARLRDDIERIENDAWHDGAKHGTSH